MKSISSILTITIGVLVLVVFSQDAHSQSLESLKWKVGPTPLLEYGPSRSFAETAVKDPSVVYADNAWHLFFTARGMGNYSIGYASAESISLLKASQKRKLSQIRGISDSYAAAPQVFYFTPRDKWYLIYQTRDSNYQPCYSTTREISNPDSWTGPQTLLKKDESEKWIDFWVICDNEHAYLFYTRDHHEVVCRSTSLESFPSGWGEPKTVFGPVHEAVHVYKVRGFEEYHLLYELRGEGGTRGFGLAKAETPLGPWKKASDRFATGESLKYWDGHPRWTEEVSHGEFIRSGSDPMMEYDPARACLLIQGINRKDHHDKYSDLEWNVGAITLDHHQGLPGFERRTFADDYGTLSCLYRAGVGAPLVLTPGTFSDATQWNEVVRALPSDLPTILIDMRGHGGSWPPKPKNSIEELAQNVLWLLTQLGIDKAYFGGHSLGGMISKEIGQVSPERTLGILSVEGWTYYKTATEAFQADMKSTQSPQQLRERAERRLRVETVWGKEAMNQFGTIWRKWNGLDFMKTTDIPIIEFYGDRNRPKPTREEMYIPERPNIEIQWFSGASHSLTVERPKELAEGMAAFLERIRKK